jgi:pyruvate/2-oxoglutarate dehydrogenase complex dihydrolipoamide acyltransferase (E2) component
MKKRGYRVVPFSANRQMAAASAAVCRERDTIHTLTEADITEPRRLIREHRERTGERLSFTAYVVTCLARAVAEQPHLSSLRRGGQLVLLDDVTIGTLVERNLGGELVPEPFGIRAADKKTYRQIHDEIRAAQQEGDARLGGLSGATWVRFIPGCLLRTFIRLASHSVLMAQRYGVVAVTAVGMFGGGPLWVVPLSSATVAVAVGGIVGRPVLLDDGACEEREHLCLTLSFDHDIVDGAPAARFTSRFVQLLSSGEALRVEIAEAGVGHILGERA